MTTTKQKLARQHRELGKEIKRLNSSGVDDLKKALDLLSGVAKIPPKDLPTRQQRRHAERQLQKKGGRS